MTTYVFGGGSNDDPWPGGQNEPLQKKANANQHQTGCSTRRTTGNTRSMLEAKHENTEGRANQSRNTGERPPLRLPRRKQNVLRFLGASAQVESMNTIVTTNRHKDTVKWRALALEYEMKISYLERALAQEESKLRIAEQVANHSMFLRVRSIVRGLRFCCQPLYLKRRYVHTFQGSRRSAHRTAFVFCQRHHYLKLKRHSPTCMRESSNAPITSPSSRKTRQSYTYSTHVPGAWYLAFYFGLQAMSQLRVHRGGVVGLACTGGVLSGIVGGRFCAAKQPFHAQFNEN